MSAIAAWPPLVSAAPAWAAPRTAPTWAPVAPSAPPRPRAADRFVSPGSERMAGEALGPVRLPATAREPRPVPAVRLTMRGRLTLTLVGVFVVALVLLGRLGETSGPGSATPDHAVAVRPGQTLSEVAVEQLPGEPVADAVARLRQLNRLGSAQVHAGQVLLVPPRG